MERQYARELIKSYLTNYVESVTKRSRKGEYICPLPHCKSGNGPKQTGAFNIYKDGTSWKCFVCGAGGDIFDLYGAINNIEDHNEQLKGLAEMYNITIDNNPEYHKQAKTEPRKEVVVVAPEAEAEDDYTNFFLQAHNDIDETDYWKQRGLSKELVDRFNLGYIAKWKHPKAPAGVPHSPRLIVPTAKGSYLARDTRADIPETEKQYSKAKVGKIKLFNRTALENTTKPVYVVEGEIDALSIVEVGGEAVALGSTAMVNSFINYIRVHRPQQALIIALDNDEAGKRAIKQLEEGLQGLDIPCYCFNPCGEYKDANEALLGNRDAFTQSVKDGEHAQEAKEQAEIANYLKNSTANYIQSFADGIVASADTKSISTGFKYLDEALDGGFYEGLYIVGAISSLGKTTLVTQIADQIAKAGQDILIFSLEMARTEIMAKSISRITLLKALEGEISTTKAKTARGITTGSRYKNYDEVETNLIKESIDEYSKFAEHIYISEGVGDIGVEDIRNTIAQHILYTGNTPLIIIDYLQILAPYNLKMTDKQNTDKAVMELKRISRDFKTPVIGISSFNRTSYKDAVSMEAFKESGAIEYSSDVLIGLQLKGAGSKNFDPTEAKSKDPRDIELVILKNRNGQTGSKVNFFYYPMFNYYKELEFN